MQGEEEFSILNISKESLRYLENKPNQNAYISFDFEISPEVKIE